MELIGLAVLVDLNNGGSGQSYRAVVTSHGALLASVAAGHVVREVGVRLIKAAVLTGVLNCHVDHIFVVGDNRTAGFSFNWH